MLKSVEDGGTSQYAGKIDLIILSLEKIAEYSGLELAEILDLQVDMKNKNGF